MAKEGEFSLTDATGTQELTTACASNSSLTSASSSRRVTRSSKVAANTVARAEFCASVVAQDCVEIFEEVIPGHVHAVDMGFLGRPLLIVAKTMSRSARNERGLVWDISLLREPRQGIAFRQCFWWVSFSQTTAGQPRLDVCPCISNFECTELHLPRFGTGLDGSNVA